MKYVRSATNVNIAYLMHQVLLEQHLASWSLADRIDGGQSSIGLDIVHFPFLYRYLMPDAQYSRVHPQSHGNNLIL